ncbi:MAG: hypothetical protein WBG28_01265, partial [Desulfobulbales bacterium]
MPWPLLRPAFFFGEVICALSGRFSQMRARLLAGEKPLLRTILAPVSSQFIKQIPGKGGVAVLFAL